MIQFQILKLKHHCHGNGIMFPSFVEYHGDEDIAEPFTTSVAHYIRHENLPIKMFPVYVSNKVKK